MILILLIGLALTGAAVALMGRALVMPRLRAAETLGQIDAYGFSAAQAVDQPRTPLLAGLDGVASFVGGLVARHFSGLREAELKRKLMAAGLYRTAPRKFLGYQILCALCFPLTWIWTASSTGYPQAITAMGLILAFPIGWLAPLRIVRRRMDRRFAEIDYDLPELIDLLVVTVEAGMGLTGSLQTASHRMQGPLGDELRLALQEQTMGLSTNEALRNMLQRCDTPLMRSFVRSVLQGETLGVSIGQIMRDLATDMRKRRRQAAEEKAQKAPIKLLFPLVFLIFPAMFIVLLAPAVFSFLNALGG
jgi:tight adherence protein C